MSEKTPMELANSEYKKLRRKFRRLSREERIKYFVYRQNRYYTRDWHKKHKEALMERVERSMTETKQWVQNHERLLDWFESAMPTEETYMLKTGTTSVHQSGFASDKSTFSMFLDRMRGEVEVVKEQLELMDEEGSSIDMVRDELIAGIAVNTGLDPHDDWNDRDDGCVWFTNSETGENYYYQMTYLAPSFGGKYEVVHSVSMSDRDWDRYSSYSVIPLNRSVVFSGGVGGVNRLGDITRVLRDYFGAWNGVKWYVRNMVENGNPVPSGFDIDY